jgi:hypothetical protein
VKLKRFRQEFGSLGSLSELAKLPKAINLQGKLPKATHFLWNISMLGCNPEKH